MAVYEKESGTPSHSKHHPNLLVEQFLYSYLLIYYQFISIKPKSNMLLKAMVATVSNYYL
jgi:hypothetical protein